MLPFVTEEVWSWWQDGSIHRAPWPAVGEAVAIVGAVPGEPALLAAASQVLHAVRRAKSQAKLSIRSPVSVVRLRGAAGSLDLLRTVAGDLRAAGRIERLAFVPDATRDLLGVEVEI